MTSLFPELAISVKALMNRGAKLKNVLSSLVCIRNCLEQSDLLAICKDHKEHTDKGKDRHIAPSTVRSSQYKWQLRQHYTTTDCQGTAQDTTLRSADPDPSGNICPSSQHFCYTGETAVDVAQLHVRAGGMAQWLGAPTALPEDLGSIPSTHMAAHNCLKIQFQGI